MKRRIVSALAIAVLLAAGIAGARGQPIDEPQFDLVPTPGQFAMTVTSGLEIISGNAAPEPTPTSEEGVAGFCTRCGGTEIAV